MPGHEFQSNAFTGVLSKHVWTAHLLSESGVDSHRLFSLFGIPLTEALVPPLMKHRPTVAYFSPADSARSGLSKGETAGERAPPRHLKAPQLLLVGGVKAGEFRFPL